MKLDIQSFFDGWEDHEVQISPMNLEGTDRVRERTMERIRKSRRRRLTLRRTLLAAAAAALLITGIWASTPSAIVRRVSPVFDEWPQYRDPKEAEVFIAYQPEVPDPEYYEVGFRCNYVPAVYRDRLISLTGADTLDYAASQVEGVTSQMSREDLESIYTHWEYTFAARMGFDMEGAVDYFSDLMGGLDSQERATAAECFDAFLASMVTYQDMEQVLSVFPGVTFEIARDMTDYLDLWHHPDGYLLTIDSFGGQEAYGREFAPIGDDVVVIEKEIGGLQALVITMDQFGQEVREAVGRGDEDPDNVSIILLYSDELDCVIMLGSNMPLAELEKVAAGLELVPTDIPSYVPAEVLRDYPLMPIAVARG